MYLSGRYQVGGWRVGGGGLGRGLEADAEDAHEVPAGIAEFDGVDGAGAFPDVLHGEAREPVAEGAYGGAAGDDDDFGETGFPFAFFAQFVQGAAGVDGEVGESRRERRREENFYVRIQ